MATDRPPEAQPAENPSGRWELSATTSEGTLDRILDLVGEMFAVEEIDESDRMQFEIAVAEIGANIIEHAGRGRPISLTLQLALFPDRLEAVFLDDGAPARVDLRSVELPDALAERGRGLAIALAALDELRYHRRSGTNRWTLVCYRSPTES
ncbi:MULTISPECIES: ATP-binding protein [Rhodococcus]|uniref:ATP-binding protein n=1 Tax=Rhodococcus TaxID=1827 RepID=UPI00082C47CE|nr:ATP-binding protein [Rhodococcus phenolicus]